MVEKNVGYARQAAEQAVSIIDSDLASKDSLRVGA
jgi:hypothetical protein